MRLGRLLSASLLLAATFTPCVAKTRKHTTKPTKATVKHASGQRSIDDTRATQIQEALVRSGYMSDVSGHWDSTTAAAMQKYQGDNGWQTKLMPDSRAIIKLGLGPSHTGAVSDGGTASSAQSAIAETSSNSELSQR
ncbi:MAG TPA: peptidoglycan-binding protein [Edaphobacter sp.]|jgi:hypothetical protein|nr:peptidoglycan-binding protein [Edaphobacter sp.]